MFPISAFNFFEFVKVSTGFFTGIITRIMNHSTRAIGFYYGFNLNLVKNLHVGLGLGMTGSK